jgi:hypothetical protein
VLGGYQIQEQTSVVQFLLSIGTFVHGLNFFLSFMGSFGSVLWSIRWNFEISSSDHFHKYFKINTGLSPLHITTIFFWGVNYLFFQLVHMNLKFYLNFFQKVSLNFILYLSPYT